jgi:hypothetical protein
VSVQGSLDQPPIVIWASKGFTLLMLLIAIVFVAIGIMVLRDPKEDHTWAYVGIILFGAGIPIFVLRLVRPDELILGPEGITWRGIFRTARFQWSDVQNFRPYSPAPKTASKHVGFDFTDSMRGGQLRHAAKALVGVEGSLGGGWELSAAKLAELLNQARARWVGAKVEP